MLKMFCLAYYNLLFVWDVLQKSKVVGFTLCLVFTYIHLLKRISKNSAEIIQLILKRAEMFGFCQLLRTAYIFIIQERLMSVWSHTAYVGTGSKLFRLFLWDPDHLQTLLVELWSGSSEEGRWRTGRAPSWPNSLQDKPCALCVRERGSWMACWV